MSSCFCIAWKTTCTSFVPRGALAATSLSSWLSPCFPTFASVIPQSAVSLAPALIKPYTSPATALIISCFSTISSSSCAISNSSSSAFVSRESIFCKTSATAARARLLPSICFSNLSTISYSDITSLLFLARSWSKPPPTSRHVYMYAFRTILLYYEFRFFSHFIV